MDVTLYSDGGRERTALDGLDVLSNKVDAMADNVSNKRYTKQFGTYLTDIDGIVSILAPEGMHKQLELMRDYRKPRPYERQLQEELHKLFSNEPHGDIMMLTDLTLGSLNGTLDTGYSGAGELDLLKIYKYRKYEMAMIHKEYGYRGVVLVLKYFVDFWYKI